MIFYYFPKSSEFNIEENFNKPPAQNWGFIKIAASREARMLISY